MEFYSRDSRRIPSGTTKFPRSSCKYFQESFSTVSVGIFREFCKSSPKEFHGFIWEIFVGFVRSFFSEVFQSSSRNSAIISTQYYSIKFFWDVPCVISSGFFFDISPGISYKLSGRLSYEIFRSISKGILIGISWQFLVGIVGRTLNLGVILSKSLRKKYWENHSKKSRK